jgi:hypothetical protein
MFVSPRLLPSDSCFRNLKIDIFWKFCLDQAFRIYNNNLDLKRVKLLNVMMLLEFVAGI